MIRTKVAFLALLLAPALAMWSQDTGPAPAADTDPAAPPVGDSARHIPLDIAGYLSVRSLVDDDLVLHRFYREYSGSLFLTSEFGRWRFHSEFNASNAPDFDSDGLHLIPRTKNLSVKVNSALVNYNARDWFQLEAGFLFIPTYWRTHRYESTTLTVDDPLIDQVIFPTAFKGGMIHGDRYFGDGGFSYEVYGGIDQQTQLIQGTSESTFIERARMIGGKLIAHVPGGHFFQTFDLGVQRLHRVGNDGMADEIYGLSAHIVKNRVELISEFDHASVDLVNGVRTYVRQGYYVQAAYRITPKLFAVTRYDQLDPDSRDPLQSDFGRQSVGFTYRPLPGISLKLEGDRMDSQVGRQPPYYGATLAVVYFFHRP
jgi:hypothetical protein